MQGLPLLSLAIWVPIVAGLAVLTTGSDRHAPVARVVALAGAVLGFLVTIPLYTGFQLSARGFQFIEIKPWIETFRVNYHLGIDGISLLLILLNSFTTVLVVLDKFVLPRWANCNVPQLEEISEQQHAQKVTRRGASRSD